MLSKHRAKEVSNDGLKVRYFEAWLKKMTNCVGGVLTSSWSSIKTNHVDKFNPTEATKLANGLEASYTSPPLITDKLRPLVSVVTFIRFKQRQ